MGRTADTASRRSPTAFAQVSVQFTSVFHDPRTGNTDVTATQQATIHLMNAGLIHHSTCGQRRSASGAGDGAVTAANGTTIPQTFVTISWTASVDEGAGEKDVERYALYRRLSTVLDVRRTVRQRACRRGSYTFNDTDCRAGRRGSTASPRRTARRRVRRSATRRQLSFREDSTHDYTHLIPRRLASPCARAAVSRCSSRCSSSSASARSRCRRSI